MCCNNPFSSEISGSLERGFHELKKIAWKPKCAEVDVEQINLMIQ